MVPSEHESAHIPPPNYNRIADFWKVGIFRSFQISHQIRQFGLYETKENHNSN